MKFRETLSVIFINGIVLFVGLVALDVLFGRYLVSNPLDRLFIPADTVEYFDASSLYGRKELVIYQRDSLGLRGGYTELSEIDILTIGGSTTDQRYVSEGETWQDYLRAAFAENQRDISVVNAGIDGQSTIGHIAAIDEWLSKIENLRPKFIIAYVGINDIELSSSEYYDDMVHARSLGMRIRESSALWHFYRAIRGMIYADVRNLRHRKKSVAQDVVWEPAPPLAAINEDLSRRLKQYDTRLKTLVQRIKAFGAIPILVTQPHMAFRFRNGKLYARNGQLGGNVEEQIQFNFQTMRTCQNGDASICVNLALELIFEDDDYYDPIHNTPKGTKKIGDYLYSKLQNRI